LDDKIFFLVGFKNALFHYLFMRLNDDEIVAEIKIRLENEKSLKKRFLLKKILDLFKGME